MIENKIRHKDSKNELELNPFELAKEKNQLRFVDLFARINSLRIMFWALFALTFVTVLAFFMLLKKPLIVPYVIEVTPSGSIINYGKMASFDNEQLSDLTVKKLTTDFLNNIRRIDNDVIVIKRNWTRAYNYISSDASLILDKMFNEINPLENYKNYLVDIKIVSFLDKSDKAKEIEFVETSYSHAGAVIEKRAYRCMLTFNVVGSMANEQNPEGFYITSFVIGDIQR